MPAPAEPPHPSPEGVSCGRAPRGHAAARSGHWRDNRRLTAGLLLLWSVVTFGGTYFARELDFRFAGWPFGFWLAAQGALLVFLAIVAVYAWRMRTIDRRWGFEEPEE
ncbi:MAG: DUF4212 domain-containing protein [Pseudomonadota bacterium]